MPWWWIALFYTATAAERISSSVRSHGLSLITEGNKVKSLEEGREYLLVKDKGAKETDQDVKGCPEIALGNANVWFAPKVQETTVRSGGWFTNDGGNLVTYTQDLFAYSYDTVYLYVNNNLFSIIAPQFHQHDTIITNSKTGLQIEDCNGEIIYELVELSESESYAYEIYDANGILVAYSRRGKLFPDQQQWFDERGEPLAISQSPAISSKNHVMLDNRVKDNEAAIYETEFIVNDQSILGKAENRWVLMAAVTVRALRNSMRAPDGSPVTPGAYRWFQLLAVILLLVILTFSCCGLYTIYRMVYPMKKENGPHDIFPFVKPNKGQYGSFPNQNPFTSSRMPSHLRSQNRLGPLGHSGPLSDGGSVRQLPGSNMRHQHGSSSQAGSWRHPSPSAQSGVTQQNDQRTPDGDARDELFDVLAAQFQRRNRPADGTDVANNGSLQSEQPRDPQRVPQRDTQRVPQQEPQREVQRGPQREVQRDVHQQLESSHAAVMHQGGLPNRRSSVQ